MSIIKTLHNYGAIILTVCFLLVLLHCCKRYHIVRPDYCQSCSGNKCKKHLIARASRPVTSSEKFVLPEQKSIDGDVHAVRLVILLANTRRHSNYFRYI